MTLSSQQNSLLLATYYRGGLPDDLVWTSNSDQILTLSFFYTGDITFADCAARFALRPYLQGVYDDDGELNRQIDERYLLLINLLQDHGTLIEGRGNWQLPADPTFTSCRLTQAGLDLVPSLVSLFPTKPDFPNWPDRRLSPLLV